MADIDNPRLQRALTDILEGSGHELAARRAARHHVGVTPSESPLPSDEVLDELVNLGVRATLDNVALFEEWAERVRAKLPDDFDPDQDGMT